MAQKPVVREKDRGMRAITELAQHFAANPPVLAVGITGKAAEAVHRGSEGNETVVSIAVKHEFGEGRTPARSFIRRTFDQNQEAYRDAVRKAFAATLDSAVRTRQGGVGSVSTALKRLGLRVEGDIKQTIAAGIPPALSPYTLKRKGETKTTPLIDTGQLRASITSAIYSQTEVRR